LDENMRPGEVLLIPVNNANSNVAIISQTQDFTIKTKLDINEPDE